MPKVSVIVPIWNVEKYLPKCLDSLINQTLKDIEIICINDGSPDNCLNILKEYQAKDNRIIIIDQKNHGQGHARNSGLKIAKGEYIMFCDPDDYYELSMCEEMYNTIVDNECDSVVCDVNIVKETNSIFLKKIDFIGDYEQKYKGIKVVDNDVIHLISVSPCIKIYKKSLIDEYNIVFPDGLIHEDLSFFYKYFSVCKNVFFLNKKLYNRLLRKNSIMYFVKIKKHNSFIDIILNIEDFFNFLQKNNLLNQKNELILNAFFNLTHTDKRQKKLIKLEDIVQMCQILDKILLNKNINLSSLNEKQKSIIELIKNKEYKKILHTMKHSYEYQIKCNIKLFDFISLFKIEEYLNKVDLLKKKFYILHIPILKIVKKNNKTYIKLFGFIPLFKIKKC